mmetsp:Transcript_34711/g.88185  ORF Transcript_34711/g.88185 Transcript_34711/m.88185 type:complete len:205 (-) Transcript_34711:102-716(-)
MVALARGARRRPVPGAAPNGRAAARGAQHSAVLHKADLWGLFTELLALHEDAVLADQRHATEAARHPRGAVALAAGEAAHGEREGVALLDCGLAASEEGSVAGCEVHLHRGFARDLVALKGVGILQDPALVDQPHVLGLDVAEFLREFLDVADRRGGLELQVEGGHTGDLEVHLHAARAGRLLPRLLEAQGAHGLDDSGRHLSL